MEKKVVYDDLRYGQFSDKAVVDGRVRKITYKSDVDTVTAVLPHFWDFARNLRSTLPSSSLSLPPNTYLQTWTLNTACFSKIPAPAQSVIERT